MFYQDIIYVMLCRVYIQTAISQVRYTRNVLVLRSVFWQKFSTLFSFAL